MIQDEFQSKVIQIVKEKGEVRATVGVSVATLFKLDTGFNGALFFKDDTLLISYNENRNLLFVRMKYPFEKNILYSKGEETIYFDEDFDYLTNHINFLLGLAEEDGLTCPKCKVLSSGRAWDSKTTEPLRGRTYHYDSVLLKTTNVHDRFVCPQCNGESEKRHLLK